jgi:hypothetical protein
MSESFSMVFQLIDRSLREIHNRLFYTEGSQMCLEMCKHCVYSLHRIYRIKNLDTKCYFTFVRVLVKYNLIDPGSVKWNSREEWNG